MLDACVKVESRIENCMSQNINLVRKIRSPSRTLCFGKQRQSLQ